MSTFTRIRRQFDAKFRREISVRARALSPAFRVVARIPAHSPRGTRLADSTDGCNTLHWGMGSRPLYGLYSVCHPPLKLAQRPNVRGDHVGPESTRCPTF